MSLQKPPRKDAPSRAVARILMLLVLAVATGLVIFTAVTSQRVDLTEDRRVSAVELEDAALVDGFRLNVVEDEGGSAPVVILHDVDATGGLILEDLSGSLGDDYRGVRIDLPGFGYSDRIPTEGPRHTVAVKAEMIAAVIEERLPGRVLVVGVGHGGEVAAELAHSYPNVVAGVVMVDVDFWAPAAFEESLQQLPWIGRAATYTWETGGRFAIDNWAPHCGVGGWCPSDSQLAERASIIELEDTTDSIWAFRQTLEAALAPANLAEIAVSGAYVWSTSGDVRQGTVDRISVEWAGFEVFESSSFAAHLEDAPVIVRALDAVADG